MKRALFVIILCLSIICELSLRDTPGQAQTAATPSPSRAASGQGDAVHNSPSASPAPVEIREIPEQAPPGWDQSQWTATRKACIEKCEGKP